jgi:uncharacterized membrane protein
MNVLIEKLFMGKAGNILLLGIMLIVLGIISIIVSYQINASFTNKITGMVVTNLFVGRVPSLSLGYASGLSSFWVIFTNVMVELILVFILYPLFVLSFNGMLKFKVLENFFTQVKEKKEQHKDTFNKYGRFGLFVFVFIPFWMTGPIVGAMVGFLIGLRHYVIMFIVFIATIISITLWAVFLQEIIEALRLFDVRLLWVLLIVFLLFMILLRYKNVLYDKIQKIFTKKHP